MDIEHSTILSQRLSRYIGRMIWVFFILLALTFIFFLQQAEQKINVDIKTHQLAEEALILNINLQQVIDETLQQKHLSELVEQHKTIAEKLIQFNSVVHAPSLNNVIENVNSYNDVVYSIASNLPDNIEFLAVKQSQLEETLNNLQFIIAELSAKRSLLEQRISKNKEAPPSLLQAYMELSEQQGNYQIAQTNLMLFSELLKNLSPFTELSAFDEKMTHIKNELRDWENQHPYLLKRTSPFNDHYKNSSPLLVSSEKGIEKWRDTLQKVQTYFNFLQEKKLALWQLKYTVAFTAPEINQLSANSNIIRTYVNANIIKLNDLLRKNQVKWKGQLIQLTYFSFTLALLIFLGINLFLFMLYGIKCKWLSAQITQNQKEFFKNNKAIEKIEVALEHEEVIDISSALDEENTKNREHIEALSQELHLLQMQMSSQNKEVNTQLSLLDKSKQKITSLEMEKSGLILSHASALNDIKTQHKKLIIKSKHMIVRTLLQSQSASIGTGGSALQVYRHLTRMFDWCNQLSTPLRETSSSVSMYSEISAAMYKMMLEAQWQRNTILLNSHIELSNVDVNAGLFQRMLVYVGRLLLLDQFKSTLTLTITSPQTKNENVEFLTFEFNVVADKNRKKIPLLVQEFINTLSDASLVKPEAVAYIHQLLNALNANNLNIQQNDSGYALTFELPLKAKVKVEQAHLLLDTKLIVLTDQAELIQVLEKQCGMLSTDVTIAGDFSKAKESAQLVGANDAVIFLLADDCYDKDFDLLHGYINQQSQPERYKIMVLQSSYHSALHRQGLYTQAASPLFPDVLGRQLKLLSESSEITNECYSSEVMSQYQYQVTQAEVLFVSDKASNHQTLIRVLHWLGLQVNVVANIETMQRYWESGRYLILVTDLAHNPFIELSAGKTIKRAVFTLEPAQYEAFQAENPQDQKSLLVQMQEWANQREEAKSWVLEQLSTLENIDQLVAQLSPWLKPKELESAVPLVEISKSTEVQNKAGSEVKTLLEPKIEALKPVVINTDTTSVADNSIAAGETSEDRVSFDLSQFSVNQGTPELAVYMLDEYLAELSELHDSLKVSLQDNEVDQVKSQVSSIKLLALIMAAEPLQEACEQLEIAFSNNKSDEVSALVEKLSSRLEELIIFVEEI